MRDDVVITGIGACGVWGEGAGELWRAAVGARGLASFEARTIEEKRIPTCRCATPRLAPEFVRTLRGCDPASVFALAAGLEAARDAGLDKTPAPAERVACVMGTSRGPATTWAQSVVAHHEGARLGPSGLAPGTLVAVAGPVAASLGVQGPSMVVSAACSSGAHALAVGAMLIRAGAADVVIAGGADAPLHAAVVEPFFRAGLIAQHEDATRACRPFDRDRNGAVLGEGAGVLVIESRRSAAARGARVRAVLAGAGMAGDGGPRTNIDEQATGLLRSMEQAAADAGLQARDIGHINAHGTGTLRNDAAEALAIEKFFGGNRPACSATKPVTGHCAGASAAMEVILCVQALENQALPPTANCENPAFDLDVVRGEARAARLNAACSTSLGFWGVASCIIVTRA